MRVGQTALVARACEQRLTPLEAARRLAAVAPGVALLHSAEPGAHGARGRSSFVGAYPDRVSANFDPHEEVEGVGEHAALPRWIGVLPYEARRQLERASWTRQEQRPAPLLSQPLWQRYPAVLRFDRGNGQPLAVGDDLAAVTRLLAALKAPAATAECRVRVAAHEQQAVHLARIRRARELIVAGDLYQVCMARRLDVELQGAAIELYARMAARTLPEYGAYLQLPNNVRVLSSSPELLLRAAVKRGQLTQLWSEPIKGTRPRGSNAAEDAALRAELAEDQKERAELAMIVDVVRNDLSSVCRLGSVRLARRPHVVTHRTIHHRRALLTGQADPLIERHAVLKAMLPSGSVTGAPKVRAMEVIADLESERRGLYTGGLGYVSRAGGVHLAMAIRTLVLRGERGHYWTGGGIVADSDPTNEWHETGWKAQHLLA